MIEVCTQKSLLIFMSVLKKSVHLCICVENNKNIELFSYTKRKI